jgi:hypothetical protein
MATSDDLELNMESRIAKLESDVAAIMADIAVIKATGATKTEQAALAGDYNADIAALASATKVALANQAAEIKIGLAVFDSECRVKIAETKASIAMWVGGVIVVAIQLLPLLFRHTS